jgi:hypothetical protein
VSDERRVRACRRWLTCSAPNGQVVHEQLTGGNVLNAYTFRVITIRSGTSDSAVRRLTQKVLDLGYTTLPDRVQAQWPPDVHRFKPPPGMGMPQLTVATCAAGEQLSTTGLSVPDGRTGVIVTL